jgi:hypothetical protein
MMALVRSVWARIRSRRRSRFSKSLPPQATSRWVHGRRGGGRRSDLDACRVLQELVGQLLDFGRHGGREEQRLTGERDEFDDALDVGNEAHVEHPVGFIDDQQFDAGHQQLAAFGVIEQAAGRGDQHIGAALKLADPVRQTKRRRSAERC